jgi:hypothetical protein
MSEYYSTQASVEYLITATRLAGFTDGDGDGIPDSDILDYGFAKMKAIILGYLKPQYDQDIMDGWTSTTCPALIGYLSDCLCARLFYRHNPRFQEAANTIYNEAIQMLKDIRAGLMDIYDLDRDVSHLENLITTNRSNSDFDPARDLDDMTVRPTWVLPDNRDLEGY